MTDSTDRIVAVALAAAERHVGRRSAEGAEHGQLVQRFPGGRTYLRETEDGKPISSMVLDPAPNGDRVVYELVGIDTRDLT